VDSLGTVNLPVGDLCDIGRNAPQLKLYNDTIFVSWGNMNKIGSINKPNVAGPACELQLDYFTLPLTKVNKSRNFYEVVYPLNIDNVVIVDTPVCTAQTLEPRVSHANANYIWSNGATSPTITVT